MSNIEAKGKATGTLSVIAKTRASVILDRSGSMLSMRDDVIGGFNSLIDEQAQIEGEMSWSMLQFDTQGMDRTFTDKPTNQVPKLTHKTYVPRAGTPLLDAVGTELARLGETSEPTVVVIITDGQENSSREYELETIRQMIKAREDLGWQFIFLGANQDAFASRGHYGMGARGQSITYDQGTVNAAYGQVSNSMSHYRTTGESRGAHADLTQTGDSNDPDPDPDAPKPKREGKGHDRFKS